MVNFSRAIGLMIFILFASSAFSQTNSTSETKQNKAKDSKKDKSKAGQTEVRPIEFKANLMVLGADGKYTDVKQEDCKIFEDGVEQKITYFAKKQEGLNVGLVIDNTGSLRTQLENVITAANTFVNSIRPQDEAFILRFVSSDKIEVVQDWTTDKKKLNSALSALFVEGGQSAIIDALYLAENRILEREKKEPSSRNALILITDGEDRASFYDKKDLFELFKKSDTQIFTIGLTGQLESYRKFGDRDLSSQSKAKNFINQISYMTGGAAFFVNSRKDEELIAALKGVLNELSSQYIIGYVSTNQKHGADTRKITVQVSDGVNGEKRQTFIREKVSVFDEK